MMQDPLSLTGKRWRDREWDEGGVRKLCEGLSLDPVLGRVLFLRGLRTVDRARDFLDSSLSRLRNPHEIPGIIPAAERVAEAIERGERICVYGDYDVDGVTATSLMVLVLRRLGADVFPVLPDRHRHGYGLHSDILHRIHEEASVDLLITVDNGISAREEVAEARSLGMDVIITDHHEPPSELPDTPYLLNPRLHVDPVPEGESEADEDFALLSGVGLAFSLLVVLRAKMREMRSVHAVDLPNLREYLDLVTLGTIGDVVPLRGTNRILVSRGLREIARTKNRGLRALLRVSGSVERPITEGLVGFVLAPRINAAGRMGDAERALQLLTASDDGKAETLASILDRENRNRREVEREMIEDILEKIDRKGTPDRVIVLSSEDWHPGVLGIAAARIVEHFYRPVILITRKNGIGSGSGRSIPGFSLVAALAACQEDLRSFGGHRMAAGLSLSWEKIQPFRKQINRYAEQVLEDQDLVPSIQVDGPLSPDRISERLLNDLERLKPYGMGNPEPIFFSGGIVVKNPAVVGGDHIRFRIPGKQGDLNAIGFGMRRIFNSLQGGSSLDLLYHLRFNEFNGSRSIQAVLVDLRQSA